jgi:hypothetical protein
MPRSLRPFAVDVIEAYGFPFSPYNTKQCNDKGEHTGSPLQKQQKNTRSRGRPMCLPNKTTARQQQGRTHRFAPTKTTKKHQQ